MTPPSETKIELPSKAFAEIAMAQHTMKTTVLCPMENQNPTEMGIVPRCIKLRVTLSMLAMWSASTAWRSPNVHAKITGASRDGHASEAIPAAERQSTFAATSANTSATPHRDVPQAIEAAIGSKFTSHVIDHIDFVTCAVKRKTHAPLWDVTQLSRK